MKSEVIAERRFSGQTGAVVLHLMVCGTGDFFNLCSWWDEHNDVITLKREELEWLQEAIGVALRETDKKHHPVTGDPVACCGKPESHF